MLAWMPIVIFMIAMALGAPVAFAMLFGSLFYFLLSPDVPASILVQRLIAGVDSFTILAVPFFVMAGTVMSRGGITDRLFNLADALVGHLKGGLGHVNVLQSVFIGGMSGSANADAAIDCKTLVPVMIKHGYSKAFTCSVTAASGIIAAIIPPSLAFVIYALIAEVSIGRLFIGGIIPGLLIAAAEMVVVAIISHRRGYGGARKRTRPLAGGGQMPQGSLLGPDDAGHSDRRAARGSLHADRARRSCRDLRPAGRHLRL